MTIQTILAPMPSRSETGALETACLAARHLQAHVAGLYIESRVASPALPVAPRAAGIDVTGGYVVAHAAPAPAEPGAPRTIDLDREESACHAQFKHQCSNLGVPVLEEEDVGEHPLPSASWHRDNGEVDRILAREAPAFDLVVTKSGGAVHGNSKSAMGVADTALLDTGRPVLLAPIHAPKDFACPILVAWEDTAPCWHALSAAIPFLEKATEVRLINLGDDLRQRVSLVRARDYLGWHGIECDTDQAPLGKRSVSDALLTEAAEMSAGLLVMGAYSHSKLRETLLGGATREILSHAAATSVLMAH